ncbi:speckle-type POZ protein-like [Planococcus citri]|uniref:speckle-type POZ protein-like n=1 Tax=Planococcus citri TaxID=170843 RepID=UPI0031F8B06C
MRQQQQQRQRAQVGQVIVPQQISLPQQMIRVSQQNGIRMIQTVSAQPVLQHSQVATLTKSFDKTSMDTIVLTQDDCGKSFHLKKFNFSWTVDNFWSSPTPSGAVPAKVESPLFSSVEEDFKCRVECKTTQLYFMLPNTTTFTAGDKSLIIKLHIICNIGKYDGILGDVEFSVVSPQHSTTTAPIVKKKKFNIDNANLSEKSGLCTVEFRDFTKTDLLDIDNCVIENKVTIACCVFYATFANRSRCSSDYRLFDDYERLLTEEYYSDATIKIKDKDYPVYKGVLAARSPVFDAMFRNDMQENATNVVNIADISQEVFEDMLLYIYSGKVKNLKLAYELIPAADKYDLKGLKDICGAELCEQLSKDTAIKILILAHTHHVDFLKKKALEFIKENTRYSEVKNSEIWNVLISFHADLMAEMLAVLLDR